MPKFDATINGKSLASYGVEPNMATVPQPEAKTYQAEIPGRDGLLDYTDAYGVVRYENRTVTIEAYEIGDIAARMEHRRAVCSDMHGKTCTLALTTLPGYTFTGRCSVEYDEDGSETAYKLSFDCQPYMSAGERTFVGNCAGGVDLVFMSGDKPVKPRIEVPRHSIIIFNCQQYEVEAGTWTFDGIVFKRGRNEVYINTYTEPGTTTWGDLESMTWEQIGWHHKTADASGALVNVTDALQARPNKLVVDGKSAQVMTTGKNLSPYYSSGSLNASGWTKGGTYNGGDVWKRNSVYNGITNAIQVDAGKTYTFSVFAKAGATLNASFYVVDTTMPDRATVSLNTKSVAVTTSWVQVNISFAVTTSGTIAPRLELTTGGTYLYVCNPQIELNSNVTPYEPYTGGKQSPSPDYPQEVDVVDGPVTVKVADGSQALVNQQTITLPSDHNYLASLPDGTRDELVLRADGVAVLTERVNKRVLNGLDTWKYSAGVSFPFRLVDATLASEYQQLMCESYTVREYASTSETQGVTVSSQKALNTFCFRDTTIDQTVDAWKAKLAAYNVTVYYALATTTVRYSADNGTTWSTTDPAAGNSAIQLYKGTNNVWCTDALSPTITLNYDTQERTRKQRVSELYWRKSPPQRRLTWGQLATHTWAEIGSKPVQEWYYSGTANVVENAYINYEIGDL